MADTEETAPGHTTPNVRQFEQSLKPKRNMAQSDVIAICLKCHEIFDDPRLLSCLHSFCKNCIRGMTSVVGSNTVVRCIVCRSMTALPNDGVDGIPVNLYLEHEATIATFEKRMNGTTKPECEECTRQPPLETQSFCCTCVSFLCEKCHKQHAVSKKSHLHHKTLMLEGTENIKDKLRANLTFLPTPCSIHPRMEIAFFCNDCKLLVCVQCALSKHPGHHVEDLQDFVKRQKGAFCDDIKELPEIISKLEDLMNNGKKVCDNIKLREHTIHENINKVFEELHHALDTRKAVLQQECGAIVGNKLSSLSTQIEELASLKDAIITCNDFVSISKEMFDSSEFIAILTTLSGRIENIKMKVRSTSMDLIEDDSISLNSDTTAVQNGISSMGSVFVVKTEEYASLHDPISTVKTSNAYHVAVHRNGLYIVANHIGDTIEVYDALGNRLSTFGCQGTRPGQFKRPLGVTVVGDILYIVEFNGSRCQKMTIKGEFLCEIGSGKLSGAWGCAVNKNGVVYIAEETSNRVQVFTPDGKSMKILCTTPMVYAPRDVTIDKHGKIHVAACGSKCVKVFDPNGTFIREYGGNGQLQEPSGVAVDQLGFCFVADWSGKCLQVFDPTGKHMNKVEFDGCISGVTIDDNNHVHVVNQSSQTISKY